MDRKFELNPRLLEKEHFERCQLKNCEAACCLHGVWVDEEKVTKILSFKDHIKSEMVPDYPNADLWFEDRKETDPFLPSGKVIHTSVIEKPQHYGGSACIFLRSDFKCALQVTSEKLGEHKWYLKPFYCALHPLDLDENGKITIDNAGELLIEEGSCLVPVEKPISLMETFKEELIYFIGQDEYEWLLRSNQ